MPEKCCFHGLVPTQNETAILTRLLYGYSTTEIAQYNREHLCYNLPPNQVGTRLCHICLGWVCNFHMIYHICSPPQTITSYTSTQTTPKLVKKCNVISCDQPALTFNRCISHGDRRRFPGP